MSNASHAPASEVERIEALALRSTSRPWPFAADNSAAIASHWLRRKAQNPAFFNGRVFVLRSLARQPGGYQAELSLVEFKAFLYWRDGGYASTDALDTFGVALVRSREGHVLLARHAPGTLNAGSIHLPGGFLDQRDARADGVVDIDRAIARELAEETGLAVAGLERRPGYLVARSGRALGFCIELWAPSGSAALAEAMREGARRDGEQEVADIVVVRRLADLDGLPVLPYARGLVAHAFDRHA